MNGQPQSNNSAGRSGGPPKGKFRQNTRQRRQPLQQFAVPGPGNTLTPPAFTQVGFMQRIFLNVRLLAQVDGTGITGGGYSYLAPWGFFKNVSLDFNLGATNIVKASGFGLHLLQNTRHRAFNDQTTSIANDPLYNLPSLASVPAGTVIPIEFCIELPVAANDGRNFQLGLLNLQAPEAQLSLSITLGAIGDIFNSTAAAHITGITGNVYADYEYYEVPSPARNSAYPPLVVHRVWEDNSAVTATGELIYQIPRQGRLLRMISYFDNGGTIITQGAPQVGTGAFISPATPGIDRFLVRANLTDTVYSESYQFRRWLMAELLGNGGSNGTAPDGGATQVMGGGFIQEFFGAEGEPARGDFRDVLDTEAVTTLQFITDINSGLSLNAGAKMGFVREFFQPLSASAITGGIGG